MKQESKDEKRAKVVEALNNARSRELHAIYQYMNQHYNLDDMDYGDLAAKIKLIAIDEMRHAEMFAERIKELDGEPTAEPSQKTVAGQPVEKVFPFDSGLESTTIEVYNQLAQTCRANGDSTSANLIEVIIDEEQVHLSYFDNIGNHVKKLGPAFLSQVANTPADTGPPARGFISFKGDEDA